MLLVELDMAQSIDKCVRAEVFMAMKINVEVLWVITLHSLLVNDNKRFVRTWRFRTQNKKHCSFSALVI